jgi:hypothetical protein
LVREHGRIPEYLLTHWTGVPDSLIAAVPGDSATVAAGFHKLLRRDSTSFSAGTPQASPPGLHKLLRRDSTFNALFLPVVDRYLSAHGGDLVGFESPPPTPLAYDEFLDIAVRFFYPDAIRPDGTIQSHACVKINGVRELEGPPQPYAEASPSRREPGKAVMSATRTKRMSRAPIPMPGSTARPTAREHP